MIHQPNENPYHGELSEYLALQSGLEDQLDGLRKFKRERSNPLREKFLQKKISLRALMESLTDLADAVLVAAYEMARESLQPTLGLPQFRDNDGNYLPGELAIIGLGKLGGRELHFNSDLDVIFIYNRNGETLGPRQMTNREYFAKLSQRIIGYLTLHTRYSYAYKVDTELRPSGRAGALVTPMDSWTGYYHDLGQIWERQALLKARLIHASGNFAGEFQGLFRRLIFLKPFPEELGEEIHRLRLRIEKELARESPRRWHFKKGFGGLVEIEFLVQYLQLKFGKMFDDLLSPNTLNALEAISKRDLLTLDQYDLLKNAYEFYRRLEFHLSFQTEGSEEALDPLGETTAALAQAMGHKNREDFLEKFTYYRHEVRKLYVNTLKVRGE